MSRDSVSEVVSLPVSAKARGIRWHWLALTGVVCLLAGITLWPAMDAWRPVAEVRVEAVLPGPASGLPSAGNAASSKPGTVGLQTAMQSTRAVQAAGWIEPDPYFVAVAALADGVVASMHVLAGEAVEAGQLIAELVPDDAALALQRTEADLLAARAGLAQATAAQSAAQVDWDEPVERERAVAVATAARQEAESMLAQWPARVRAAESDLARWQEELERLAAAFNNAAAADRERVVLENQVALRQATLDGLHEEESELRARVDRFAAEARAAVRAAELRVNEQQALDAAHAMVAAAQARVADAEVRVAEARLRLDRMTIVAPMAGQVLRRLKSPGDKVMMAMDEMHSSHLVHLYDPTQLQVRVDVPLADVGQIFVGQRCEVVVDVLPDERFVGEVTRITDEADLQKNTLEIKVHVIDPSPLLRPEMLARVRMLSGQGRQGREVTRQDNGNAASRWAEGSGRSEAETSVVRISEVCLDDEQVWVVRDRRGPRGSIVSTGVEVLARADGFVTIAAPLHVGDLLVREPQGLTTGARVRINQEKADDQGGDV